MRYAHFGTAREARRRYYPSRFAHTCALRAWYAPTARRYYPSRGKCPKKTFILKKSTTRIFKKTGIHV
jgi:hypothetical protein